MYYECITQDTFNKLEVGKIYYIEDNWFKGINMIKEIEKWEKGE